MVDTHGIQTTALNYPGISQTFVFDSVDAFYPPLMKRRLREGVEFFTFLRKRKTSHTAQS